MEVRRVDRSQAGRNPLADVGFPASAFRFSQANAGP
jgi:hypothetical protein